MERTPLETARDFCGKNPDALPPGKYRVVDKLHDRGTDRLLGDIASAPDANSVWARRAAEEFIAASGVLGRELDTKFLSLAFERAILRGHIQGANSALDKMQAACGSVGLNGDADTIRTESGKVGPSKVNNATDLGDGLGLPLVSVGPGPIGSVTQREIPASDPKGCRVETDHDRHNDDDRQRAAQARADAAESDSDND